MQSNDTLRRALESFIGLPLVKQSEEMTKINEKFSCNILQIEFSGRLNQSVCYSYALGVSDCDLNRYPSRYLKEFIKSGSLKENELGDLLIYYGKYDEPQHAAVARNGIISSKWGNGYVWKHEILEVPQSYGLPKRFDMPDISLIDQFLLLKYGDDDCLCQKGGNYRVCHGKP